MDYKDLTMHSEKIAIFGASGLVGSRLCESLYLNKRYDFRALIHSTGNAFRIARYPMEIEQVNLLDRSQIDRVLRDCDVVVNCSRGDKPVMLQGFKNLIRASEKRKIKKFVHLSSVLIYGPNPSPESYSEDCSPDPQGNDYGILKLQQDNILLKRKSSFQSIILCPPNIYGPYGGFTYAVMNYLQSGKLFWVDEGKNPCNVVHVDNLVLAIYKAIENNLVNRERFFIKDEGDITWKDFLLKFANIMGIEAQFINLESSHLEVNKDTFNKKSILESCYDMAKYLASTEVRTTLLRLPVFKEFLSFISYRFSCLNPRLQEKIKEKLFSTTIMHKEPRSNDFNNDLVKLQTRKVSHSINKAKNILGYEPLLDLDSGLEYTKFWMKFNNLI